MLYSDFLIECQKKQRSYIKEEKAKMQRALGYFNIYAGLMRALGLHPLTRTEIDDRSRELFTMERDVLETHGDGPAMRAAYTMHHREPAHGRP